MAKRRRRESDDDDDFREKVRSESDSEPKRRGSRSDRRAKYEQQQDLKLFGVFIIIIIGIISGYLFIDKYYLEDTGDNFTPKIFEPPTNHTQPPPDTSLYYYPTPSPSDPSNTVVVMEVKDFGSIVFELYDQKVPVTVDNFKKYVNDGFYDGLIFHRVAQSPSVIQGGGYMPGMTSKSATYSPINLEIDNSLTHVDGALAMARTSDPNSATSQFYISVGENHYLDDSEMKKSGQDGYAVFGQVIYGQNVYQAIHNVEVNEEQPVNDVIIQKAYVYTQ